MTIELLRPERVSAYVPQEPDIIGVSSGLGERRCASVTLHTSHLPMHSSAARVLILAQIIYINLTNSVEQKQLKTTPKHHQQMT